MGFGVDAGLSGCEGSIKAVGPRVEQGVRLQRFQGVVFTSTPGFMAGLFGFERKFLSTTP